MYKLKNVTHAYVKQKTYLGTNYARTFDREEHYMQGHLYDHFTLPGHSGFLHDISITLIEKTDLSCPTKREDYMIETFKNKARIFGVDDSFCADCYFYIPAAGFGRLCSRT